jgi:DNA ligase (NAD+)
LYHGIIYYIFYFLFRMKKYKSGSPPIQKTKKRKFIISDEPFNKSVDKSVDKSVKVQAEEFLRLPTGTTVNITQSEYFTIVPYSASVTAMLRKSTSSRPLIAAVSDELPELIPTLPLIEHNAPKNKTAKKRENVDKTERATKKTKEQIEKKERKIAQRDAEKEQKRFERATQKAQAKLNKNEKPIKNTRRNKVAIQKENMVKLLRLPTGTTEFSPSPTTSPPVRSKPDKSIVLKQFIETFRKNGISVFETSDETTLSNVLAEANRLYYNSSVPFMTDNEYDILKEFVERKYPKNAVLSEIGAPIERNKVTLPYELASMDKIKPDTEALSTWKSKYKGPYVISCKLDGVSGLYVSKPTPKLYTRGNGTVGQDISHLVPYLKLQVDSDVAIRGEFIIPKEVFQAKYASKFANARNLVSGIIGRLTVDKSQIEDVKFVSYEVIKPSLKPSEQMKLLDSLNIDVVKYSLEPDITNEMLSEKLLDLRQNYAYEIDGIIVTNDEIYPRKSGNPDHSFAFKMVLSDQMAEVKVVDVLWTPSKNGLLKPRVRIEPVKLSGVTVEYATGFNGAFIEKNKIGVGALIQIIRSGDVIPHIKSVIVPAESAKMPSEPYIWNKSHVDIMLEDVEANLTVKEKNITSFFKGIDVVGLGSGNVTRIVEAGFDTVPKILKMTVDDYLTVEGFKQKMATKLHDGIIEKVAVASLETLMSASNIFGHGMGKTKITAILEKYPDILESTESDEEKVEMISRIDGLAKLSAKLFVSKIPAILIFLHDCGLDQKYKKSHGNNTSIMENAFVQDGPVAKPGAKEIDTNHSLYKKSIVMTGTRDKTVVEALGRVGAKIGNSVSKNTLVLIASDKTETSGKMTDAQKLNIPIMTPDEFMAKYFS